MAKKFERIQKFQVGTMISCREISKTKKGVTLRNCEIIFKDKTKKKIIFTSHIKIRNLS